MLIVSLQYLLYHLHSGLSNGGRQEIRTLTSIFHLDWFSKPAQQAIFAYLPLFFITVLNSQLSGKDCRVYLDRYQERFWLEHR